MSPSARLLRLQELRQLAWTTQNAAYTAMQTAWAEVTRLRNEYGPTINALRAEHDTLYAEILSMSRRIDEAFEAGDKIAGRKLVAEIREMRTRLKTYPPQWRGLVAKIQQAQADHEDARDRFIAAKGVFDQAAADVKAAKGSYQDE